MVILIQNHQSIDILILDQIYSSDWKLSKKKNVKSENLDGYINRSIVIEELTPIESLQSTTAILSSGSKYNTYVFKGKQSNLTIID